MYKPSVLLLSLALIASLPGCGQKKTKKTVEFSSQTGETPSVKTEGSSSPQSETIQKF